MFKNHKGDLSQKLSEPNIWLLVNHTKPTNILYWNKYFLTEGITNQQAGNYKTASNYKITQSTVQCWLQLIK